MEAKLFTEDELEKYLFEVIFHGPSYESIMEIDALAKEIQGLEHAFNKRVPTYIGIAAGLLVPQNVNLEIHIAKNVDLTTDYLRPCDRTVSKISLRSSGLQLVAA